MPVVTRLLYLAGFSAILGGTCWIASIVWYLQQPLDEDGIRAGWDAFNRLVTLIPVLFALPLYTMSARDGARPQVSRSLAVVLVSIAVAAICRLLVDLDLLPPSFSILTILLFMVAFLWYLARLLLAGDFPRPAIIALAATTILMLAFIGTETNLVLLAAPFGLAWIGIGAMLLMRTRAGGRAASTT